MPALWTMALLATLLFAVHVMLDVVFLNTLLRQQRLIAALERSPLVFSDAEIATGQGPFVAVVIAWMALGVLSLVAMALFLRSAWLTAAALGVRDLRYGPRWAVFAWLVPIMALFVPKRIADDVWRAGDERSPQYVLHHPRPGLVTAWWAAFLLALPLSRAASSDSRALTTIFLLHEILLGLLGAAVVIGIAVRLSQRAAAQGTPLRLPAPLRRPDPAGVPAWAPTGLAAIAAVLLVVSLATGIREGSRLPESLRAQEAAALALPAPAEARGLELQASPSPLPVPEETERPVTLDPTGPYENLLLEPPGLVRVANDPDYAGAYDLERIVATAPEADRQQVRASLESYGFVQAQQAAYDNAQSLLEVVVLEFESDAAATDWVVAGDDSAPGGFEVDTPGGTGYRTTIDEATVQDTVAVAVGPRVFQLDLFQPARFSTNEAIILLRLQHQAATGTA